MPRRTERREKLFDLLRCRYGFPRRLGVMQRWSYFVREGEPATNGADPGRVGFGGVKGLDTVLFGSTWCGL